MGSCSRRLEEEPGSISTLALFLVENPPKSPQLGNIRGWHLHYDSPASLRTELSFWGGHGRRNGYEGQGPESTGALSDKGTAGAT